jgi:hypothetical protein
MICQYDFKETTHSKPDKGGQSVRFFHFVTSRPVKLSRGIATLPG